MDGNKSHISFHALDFTSNVSAAPVSICLIPFFLEKLQPNNERACRCHCLHSGTPPTGHAHMDTRSLLCCRVFRLIGEWCSKVRKPTFGRGDIHCLFAGVVTCRALSFQSILCVLHWKNCAFTWGGSITSEHRRAHLNPNLNGSEAAGPGNLESKSEATITLSLTGGMNCKCSDLHIFLR